MILRYSFIFSLFVCSILQGMNINYNVYPAQRPPGSNTEYGCIISNKTEEPLEISLSNDTSEKQNIFIPACYKLEIEPQKSIIMAITAVKCKKLNDTLFKSDQITFHNPNNYVNELNFNFVTSTSRVLLAPKNGYFTDTLYRIQPNLIPSGNYQKPSPFLIDDEKHQPCIPLKLIIYSRFQSLLRSPRQFLEGFFNVKAFPQRWEERKNLQTYGEEWVLALWEKEQKVLQPSNSKIESNYAQTSEVLSHHNGMDYNVNQRATNGSLIVNGNYYGGTCIPTSFVPSNQKEDKKPLDGLSAQQWRARVYGSTTCLTLLASSAVAGIIYYAAKALNTFSRS